MKTLSQERAKYALNEVSAITDVKRFKPFSSGAPSIILQNGFGQAMAFWYSKMKKNNPDNEHLLLVEIIEKWLRKRFPQDFQGKKEMDFLKKLNDIDQEEYHTVQMETIKLLEWVKRYAQAFIEDPNDNKTN